MINITEKSYNSVMSLLTATTFQLSYAIDLLHQSQTTIALKIAASFEVIIEKIQKPRMINSRISEKSYYLHLELNS